MATNTIPSPVRDDVLDHPLRATTNKQKQSPPVVLIKHHGRFGKQLFTFGNLIAHSVEIETPIFNLAFHRYGNIFWDRLGTLYAAFLRGLVDSLHLFLYLRKFG